MVCGGAVGGTLEGEISGCVVGWVRVGSAV